MSTPYLVTRGGARNQGSTAAAVDEARTPLKATRSSLRRSSAMSSDQPKKVSVEEPVHHRSKRVKTEKDDAHDGLPTTKANEMTPVTAPTGAKKSAPPPKRDVSVFEMANLAAQAARDAMKNMTAPSATPAVVEARPQPTPHTPCRFGGHNVLPTSHVAAPDVDFSSAPSDPTELALWVAKQISNFGEGGRDSVDSEGSAPRSRHMGHPPAMYNRRFDDDDDPTKVAERERVREENRERKKRWRESNAERSTSSYALRSCTIPFAGEMLIR